jgi:hypothetical protein
LGVFFSIFKNLCRKKALVPNAKNGYNSTIMNLLRLLGILEISACLCRGMGLRR